jgi:hypothetical protein
MYQMCGIVLQGTSRTFYRLVRWTLPFSKLWLPTFEQCAIPAFEGLFPARHDNVVRLLLFRLAEWHALAKLRLHTDDSLARFDQALDGLGKQLRKFQQYTCSAFQTVELPREVAVRQRRCETNLQSTDRGTRSSGARPRTFNLLTYKLHALGDYVGTIRLFGTTDSYTTQIVHS